MWLWEPVLGPPVSFFPTTTMAWSHPYLALLTSAVTLYKEAKSTDAKAQEANQALPDDLKKVCMPVFVYTFNWQGDCQ